MGGIANIGAKHSSCFSQPIVTYIQAAKEEIEEEEGYDERIVCL